MSDFSVTVEQTQPSVDPASGSAERRRHRKLYVILVVVLTILVTYNVNLSIKVSTLENMVARNAGDQLQLQRNVQNSGDVLQMEIADYKEENEEKVRAKRDRGSKKSKRYAPASRERRKNFSIYGCHMVPIENNPISNDYILWKANGDRALCNMKSLSSQYRKSKKRARYISITQSGHYLVYSQLTFAGTGQSTIGFQTVMTNPITGDEVPLLTTVKKQDSSQERILDSGYHSGFFHLTKGKLLEVNLVGQARVTEFDLRPDYAYFGAILLSKT